jgi:hypothetical protein
MLRVPASIVRTRMAALVVTATQKAAPALDRVGRKQRCTGSAHEFPRRLPSAPTAVARQPRRPPSVPAVYSALPLSRLQSALRRATALFCSLPAAAVSTACLLFTSAAWKMAPRDKHIGWSEAARQANLPLVVNQSRFLILPWVKVPNLASHILSLSAQQLPRDWLAAYRAQPVLLETLVDGTRYHGGCYRAANWTEVGLTQGRGRMDRSGKAEGVRKHIFLFPLHRHWRERLCDPSPPAPKSVDEPAENLR